MKRKKYLLDNFFRIFITLYFVRITKKACNIWLFRIKIANNNQILLPNKLNHQHISLNITIKRQRQISSKTELFYFTSISIFLKTIFFNSCHIVFGSKSRRVIAIDRCLSIFLDALTRHLIIFSTKVHRNWVRSSKLGCYCRTIGTKQLF